MFYLGATSAEAKQNESAYSPHVLCFGSYTFYDTVLKHKIEICFSKTEEVKITPGMVHIFTFKCNRLSQ